MSNSTSDSMSLPELYFEVIDRLVDTTLKGKIRSKEQVYQRLVRKIQPGTGEIFERCLAERTRTTEAKLETQIKASRILRALQTIQGEWERWQKENQQNTTISAIAQQILKAEPDDRLSHLVQGIDPNQPHRLNMEQIRQLANTLQQEAELPGDRQLHQFSRGLSDGLAAFSQLEGDLIGWIYEQSRETLGFGSVTEQRGPWSLWAKKVSSYFPKALFQTLAQDRSPRELATQQPDLSLKTWVELAVLLGGIQRGLVAWFDKQPYDVKMGKRLSLSTYLVFAAIWCQLSEGFETRGEPTLAQGCFQMSLQILRTFSQRDDFPFYGGMFASFSGDYLQNTLEYLTLPLRNVEGTQEKARILTLLGYSQQALGECDRGREFHQEALEIARNAGDRLCEIASLNHLSRICIACKEYREAIDGSQRALILARQSGDRLGEANALANLGYSEVAWAHQLERMETELYDRAIDYLKQGLMLCERLGDRQSQALCCNSLGMAYGILEQPLAAIPYLEAGLEAARFSGDLYQIGLNFAYRAEAYYGLQDLEKAVGVGCLGMYLLKEINSREWRQPAGLLAIIRGQMGEEAFQAVLGQNRANIIAAIGVDGYDYLPDLLEEYQQSNN